MLLFQITKAACRRHCYTLITSFHRWYRYRSLRHPVRSRKLVLHCLNIARKLRKHGLEQLQERFIRHPCWRRWSCILDVFLRLLLGIQMLRRKQRQKFCSCVRNLPVFHLDHYHCSWRNRHSCFLRLSCPDFRLLHWSTFDQSTVPGNFKRLPNNGLRNQQLH